MELSIFATGSTAVYREVTMEYHFIPAQVVRLMHKQ